MGLLASVCYRSAAGFFSVVVSPMSLFVSWSLMYCVCDVTYVTRRSSLRCPMLSTSPLCRDGMPSAYSGLAEVTHVTSQPDRLVVWMAKDGWRHCGVPLQCNKVPERSIERCSVRVCNLCNLWCDQGSSSLRGSLVFDPMAV